MEIIWLGRTSFRIRGREGTIVTDPFPPGSGFEPGKLSADVVTVSRRDDPAYNYREGVNGNPLVLDAPGEYEVGGILVTGIATKAPDDTRNVVFLFELDGMKLAHLGCLGPDQAKSLDAIKGVDILLLPAGGGNSLGGAAAADLMTTIDPRLVIPMNYNPDGETLEGQQTLERFLKEVGSKPEPEPKVSVTRSQLPAELAVRILQPATAR